MHPIHPLVDDLLMFENKYGADMDDKTVSEILREARFAIAELYAAHCRLARRKHVFQIGYVVDGATSKILPVLKGIAAPLLRFKEPTRGIHLYGASDNGQKATIATYRMAGHLIRLNFDRARAIAECDPNEVEFYADLWVDGAKLDSFPTNRLCWPKAINMWNAEHML